MVRGFGQLARLHPKKTAAYFAITYGGLYLTYDYTLTKDIMVNSCKRAALIGDEKIKNPLAQTRHFTVILNPIAGKRKSKKLYTKWVEPILHLAGIKVSLIETNSPKQAYNLMKIMSGCDGVAIVGGDGTVHEAINGLLDRPDSAEATKKFPIAILPAGQYNSIARYIHQNLSYRNQKEFLIQATLRMVDSNTQKHDVLKVTPLESAKISSDEGPIYAMRDVRYGKYQDNFVKTSGFIFYQTRIKPIWLRLQRLFSSKYPNPKIVSIFYTEPCIGCSKCIEKHKLAKTISADSDAKNANKRWWGSIVPVPRANSAGPSEDELRELELAKRDNPDCDKWIEINRVDEISDFRACMMGDKMVRLSLSRDGEYTPSDITETQDIKLIIAPELDEERKVGASQRIEESNQVVSSSSDQPETLEGSTSPDIDASEQKKDVSKENSSSKKEDLTTKFLVDGQPIQARSVEITALDRSVTIFTGGLRFLPSEHAGKQLRPK